MLNRRNLLHYTIKFSLRSQFNPIIYFYALIPQLRYLITELAQLSKIKETKQKCRTHTKSINRKSELQQYFKFHPRTLQGVAVGKMKPSSFEDCESHICLIILGFWNLSVVQYSEEHYRTESFRNWITFLSQVMGWETPTLLDPLERANLIHSGDGQSPKTQ
jgi:hypothetical protein